MSTSKVPVHPHTARPFCRKCSASPVPCRYEPSCNVLVLTCGVCGYVAATEPRDTPIDKGAEPRMVVLPELPDDDEHDQGDDGESDDEGVE